MNRIEVELPQVPLGRRCRIVRLNHPGAIRARLLEIGLVPGAELIPLFRSWAWDPTAYLVAGTVIALRNDDARQIVIEYSEDHS